MPSPPLAHLQVVDLTDLRGALAGRLLADLGAEVVKVEPPRGDPGRWRPPFAGNQPGPDRSLPFLYRNANKRGVVIDLHDSDGWHRFCSRGTPSGPSAFAPAPTRRSTRARSAADQPATER